MKSIITKTMALFTIAITSFSFSAAPGGEGFEVFLNDKVITQQFGKDMDKMKNIELNSSSLDATLTIKYYHCGHVGTDRVLTVRDGQNNVLKQYRFSNAFMPIPSMDIPVKDLLGLKKGPATFNLYYSSNELPKGRMLVSIHTTTVNRTAP